MGEWTEENDKELRKNLSRELHALGPVSPLSPQPEKQTYGHAMYALGEYVNTLPDTPCGPFVIDLWAIATRKRGQYFGTYLSDAIDENGHRAREAAWLLDQCLQHAWLLVCTSHRDARLNDGFTATGEGSVWTRKLLKPAQRVAQAEGAQPRWLWEARATLKFPGLPVAEIVTRVPGTVERILYPQSSVGFKDVLHEPKWPNVVTALQLAWSKTCKAVAPQAAKPPTNRPLGCASPAAANLADKPVQIAPNENAPSLTISFRANTDKPAPIYVYGFGPNSEATDGLRSSYQPHALVPPSAGHPVRSPGPFAMQPLSASTVVSMRSQPRSTGASSMLTPGGPAIAHTHSASTVVNTHSKQHNTGSFGMLVLTAEDGNRVPAFSHPHSASAVPNNGSEHQGRRLSGMGKLVPMAQNGNLLLRESQKATSFNNRDMVFASANVFPNCGSNLQVNRRTTTPQAQTSASAEKDKTKEQVQVQKYPAATQQQALPPFVSTPVLVPDGGMTDSNIDPQLLNPKLMEASTDIWKASPPHSHQSFKSGGELAIPHAQGIQFYRQADHPPGIRGHQSPPGHKPPETVQEGFNEMMHKCEPRSIVDTIQKPRPAIRNSGVQNNGQMMPVAQAAQMHSFQASTPGQQTESTREQLFDFAVPPPLLGLPATLAPPDESEVQQLARQYIPHLLGIAPGDFYGQGQVLLRAANSELKRSALKQAITEAGAIRNVASNRGVAFHEIWNNGVWI